MKRYLFVIFLVLALGTVISHAEAWNEPDSVLGRRWGATLAEINIPDCKPNLCLTHISLGEGSSLGASFSFDPRGGMDLVWLSVGHDEYPLLRDILVEKYGQPTSVKQVEVKTKAGAAFSSEEASWAGKRVTILLREYDSSLNLSGATITLNTRLEREKAKYREKVKKGVDSL